MLRKHLDIQLSGQPTLAKQKTWSIMMMRMKRFVDIEFNLTSAAGAGAVD